MEDEFSEGFCQKQIFEFSFPYLDHKERREKGIDHKMNYCSFIY